MDIEVENAGVFHPTCLLHGPFQHLDRLGRVCAFSYVASFQIPKRPWGAVHDRLGKQSRYVQIIGELCVDLPHSIGEIIVPCVHGFGRLASRVTQGQRLDQFRLGLAHVFDLGQGILRSVIRPRDGPHGIVFVKRLPRFVVVTAGSIRDAPIGDGTIRVGLGGFLKAGNRFVMVIAKAPHKAAIEPHLCVFGFC